MSPLLALLHWPDFGGTTGDSLDFDTFGEISPKKRLLDSISACKLKLFTTFLSIIKME